MTPLPKRKHSKGRRDRRRAHDALQARSTVACSNCGEQRLPHTVCPNCGYYKGREVVHIAKEETKEKARFGGPSCRLSLHLRFRLKSPK